MNSGGIPVCATVLFAPEGGGSAPIRLETESLAGVGSARNFTVAGLGAASGGQVIQLRPGRTGAVSADLELRGVTAGLYQIRVVFIDETDGASPASIAIDGVTVGSWVFDGTAGTQVNPGARTGTGNQPGNWRSLTLPDAVQLDGDAVLTLAATRNAGESTRIDYIELIPVAPPNVAPTDLDLAAAAVAENAAGAVVGTLSVTDPNAGDTHVVTVDDARFEVVGTTLKLKDGVALDFEAGAPSVMVTATDAGGLARSEAFVVAVTDVNEAPSDIALVGAGVAEGALGAVVGTLSAVDSDAGDTVGYTVDDARFEVVGTTLKLRDDAALDFEAAGSVTVAVTATDAGGLTRTEDFVVAVSNVNEAPTDVALVGDSVAENGLGAVVGTISAVDPDAGDIVGYTVNDARFEVVGAALKLRDDVALDFEAAGSVTVAVTATDAGGLTRTESFVLSVTGVNEAPTDVALIGDSVAENALGAVVGTLSAVDPDAGDVVGYTVDDARFEVVGTTLKLRDGAALDFEAGAPSVVVTATDAGGLTRSETFVVAVTDVNEAPTDVALAGNSVPEGAPGAVVGTLSAVDPDAGDVVGYTVDDARFEVVGTTLKLRDGAALAEDDDGLLVTVTATDSAGLSVAEAFAVGVVPANARPVFVAGPTAVAIAENARDVATYTATDSDGPSPLAYSIEGGADAALFRIDTGGVLSFARRPDFEAPLDADGNNVYLVTVAVSDGEASTTRDVAVTVANVLETFTTFRIEAEDFAGVGATNNFALEAAAAASGGEVVRLNAGRTGSVTANLASFGLPPGQYTAVVVYYDETDGVSNGSLAIDGNAIGAWSFDGVTGAQVFPGERPGANLQVGNLRRFEFTTVFTVTATSVLTLGAVQNANESARIDYVALRPIEQPNSAPNGIVLNGAPVAENAAGAVVGTLVVDDSDVGATHNFVVADNRFEVVGTTLRLKAGISLDREAAPVIGVQVTATDVGGLSVTETLQVVVANVNEAPTGISLSRAFVTDDVAGAVAGTLTVADPDAGATHTYAVSDGRFEVVDGVLKLRDGVALDLATTESVTVSVTATDQGGLAVAKNFVIGVNAPPTALSVAGPFAVQEGVSGAGFGAVTVADANGSDVFAYAVNDARFEVVAGTLKLKDGVALDFEAGNTVAVEITATDQGGLSTTGSVLIAVGDMNETATQITLNPATLAENARRVTVGQLSANDPDAGDALIFSVQDNRFAIDGNTLKLVSNFFDFESTPVFNLEVTVTDESGATFTQLVPITILDMNEAPTVTSGPVNVTVLEGATAVGTYQGADVDAGAVLSYFIAGGNDDDFFAIDAVTGALSFIAGPDYESPRDLNVDNVYRVVVGVSDGALSGTQEVFVTVADVQEAGQSGAFIRRIDFTPADQPVATGFLADTGKAYNGTDGYGWVTEASVADGTANGTTPDAINVYGNDEVGAVNARDSDFPLNLRTYAHFEFPRAPASSAQAWAWEHALTNGTYIVRMAIGDTGGQNDSINRINLEGINVLENFVPTSTLKTALITTTVTVTDGRLTIDSIGGTNTEIQYVEIEELIDPTPGDGRPANADYSFFTTAAASVGGEGAVALELATNINPNSSFSIDVFIVTSGDTIDANSISPETVRLIEVMSGQIVTGTANTDAAGGTISFTPDAALKEDTTYTLVIDGVTTVSGQELLPYSDTFATGTNPNGGSSDVAFSREIMNVSVETPYSSLAISPDGSMLYATSLAGIITRWSIDPDTGVLFNEQQFSAPELAGRALIGIAFDPEDASVLWFTNNDPLAGSDAVDFTGKISRMTIDAGPSFDGVVEDYIIGLPRSVRDHLSNSLAFHEDENGDWQLYMTQGSNNATGAPDNSWGGRAERLLTAAVLEIDPRRDISGGPIDVQTQDPAVTLPPGAGAQVGYYNPYAAGAPVTTFATGLRNAYDLVWHSNGHLYVPTNGSAAGGNTPDDPNTIIDESLDGVGAQNDYLFDVVEGFYYGHPNPLREEYILNGGNPTSGADPGEVASDSRYEGYPVGVTPPPNYGGFAYDFSQGRSPNGAVEYLSNAFNGALKNALLVVEYSGGKDIVALKFDAQGRVIDTEVILLADARGTPLRFNKNPLDLVTDATNGFIYVMELGSEGAQITLLRPTARDPSPPQDTIYEAELAVLGGPEIDVASNQPGFTGAGFVDFQASAGESITWTFTVDTAGIYRVGFRYALAVKERDIDGRPMTLQVNGLNEGTLAFLPNARNFREWDYEYVEVELAVGSNTIRITTTGESGANIDHLSISPEPLSEINTRPTISGSQEDVSFAQGETVAFFVTGVIASDMDPNDIVEFGARLKGTDSLPDWLDFEGATQTFSQNSNPAAPGIYEIEIFAKDGQDESRETVDFAIEIVRQFDPADVDGDGTLNAADNDDDGDGVVDIRDPFQSDPNNGLATRITEGRTLVFDFSERPFGADPGYNGLGITGFLVNGNRTPEELGLGGPNLSIQNGALHIENAGTGDLPSSNLTLGAQFGIDAVARFVTISATFDHPFDTRAPARGANFGLLLSTGDTDDYVKLVLEGQNASGAFLQMETRSNGVRIDANSPAFGRNATQAPLFRAADGTDTVTFTFELDTLNGTLRATWSIRDGADTLTGSSAVITLTGDLLAAVQGNYNLTANGGAQVASGLSVGIVASSRNTTPALDVDVLEITVAGLEADPDIAIENAASPLLDRGVFSFIQNPTANNGVGNPPREFQDVSVIRIWNRGQDDLHVVDLDLDGPFKFVNAADQEGFTVGIGGFRDVAIQFDSSPLAYDPESDPRLFTGVLTITSDDPDEEATRVDLAGYWVPEPEGGQEANFNELMELFGFSTRADLSTFDNFDIYAASSPDEILAPYWQIADGYESVTVTQLAALHDVSPANIFLYEPGNNNDQESLGLLAHDNRYSQTVLPTRTNGTYPTITFDETRWAGEWSGDVFGFRVVGFYSDPRLNNDGPGDGPPGEQRGHAVRFFVAKDEAGNVIEDTYIVAQDYVIGGDPNYDYQDNVYLVRGITPADHLMII